MIIILLFIFFLEAKDRKNILILNSYHEDMMWVKNIKSGIYNVIDKNNKDNVFYVENMDTKRHNGPLYYKTLKDFYSKKYKNIKFDIIFSSDNNALDFLQKYRDDIFGNAPVVFGGVNNFDISMLGNSTNFTGVAEELALEKNMELILKLHPNIKNIFIVNDYLDTGRLTELEMKRVFEKYKDRVNLIYNKEQSIMDLRRTISKLKKDTVVLMGIFFADKDNTNMSYKRVGNYILDLAIVPIYCLVDFNISNNVIGGYVINGYAQGVLMGTLAKKILQGHLVKNIDIVKRETNNYIFNEKSIKKNNIDLSLLSSDYTLINSDYSYYDEFDDIINTNIFIIILIVLVYVLFKYKQNVFNEKTIVRILVYAPIVFLPLIIGTLIYNLVQHNQKSFKNEISTLKVEYLKEQQGIAYNEIDKIDQYIINIKKQMMTDLKLNLKKRVDEAIIISKNIYEKNKNTKTKLEIQNSIIDALSKIRFFDDKGYYSITTTDGQRVLEKGISNLDTALKKKRTKPLKEDREGYVTVSSDNLDQKMIYVKNFEPFNWKIGTAEYLENLNRKVKKEIYRYASNIRYGKHGYIFVISSQGLILAHGDSPELVGKNLINKIDYNGVRYTHEIIGKALEGSAEFTKFGWFNKQTQKIDTKYSYARYFDTYDLVIGTGVFNNDVSNIIQKETTKLNKKNNEQIKQIIVISLVVLIVVLILSYIISNMVRRIFENYNKKLNDLNISLSKRVEEEIKISKDKDNVIYQQSKMASMGEMIGNIAHQWRQPLSVISVGATGLKMQKKYDLLTDDQLLETCDYINENAQYLSKTIDDFKNFIKNDRDKVKFNLKDNIESFLCLVKSSVTSSEINVVLDLDDTIILNSYPNELTQCFMNLFSNAKDAMENQKDTKFLFITTTINAHEITILFKDNAGGINDFTIEKIFEPYFTTKHKSQGTGLGLSMTYKIIVEGMNGSIHVHNREYEHDSKSYKGAEFLITLHL